MNETYISTGEAAKISGLTIRTLQHYDNIGVLPATGRTGGGRRYYTENDMMKLEHVVFYRGLGFSLDQIKDKLLNQSAKENANELLETQKQLLFNQVCNIQNSIAAIEASQEIIMTGKTPPWTILSAFMQSLGTVDVSTWADFEFSDDQTNIFNEHMPTLEDVMDFYNTWKRLSIKAAAFHEAGVMPAEPIAQVLAKDWANMTRKATGGKDEHMDAYLEVDQKRSMWNPPERELIERAEIFLNEALELYYRKQ